MKKTKKVINTKNIRTKRYFFNLFLLLTMIISIIGGVGYYFIKNNNNPICEIIVNKQTFLQSNNNDCFDDDNNKIEHLNEEITIKNEELKDSNLSSQEKKIIEEIIKLKNQQKEELKTDLLLKKFLKKSKEEILEIDNKIKTTNQLEEKHLLTETKLLKEKEIIKYKNLLKDKEINIVNIKQLEEKLVQPGLISTTKTALENQKIQAQNKTKNINEQITKKTNIINLQTNLNAIEKELQDPQISSELKQYLIKYKENTQTKITNLEQQ
ncbi:hypothetical protein HPP_4630 [Hydrangea phyllody phytoplasma]|uniref:Uncharacterized protein n=2 Tax=16SrI (Aster yellows group) TaxID=3042590 RepID=A0ABQ5PTT4_9MOLU|nr:hypothetical protein [Hydrangea phyllody phytoplasma]GFZ75505.1 hypothetical protein HPP_4630 [Hydrangea phyllody phytoplasma]GLH61497.1 hypothetical protein RHYP_4430 [Rhus yellows phytoplasma]GLH62086.1 hypothetical protein HP2P_4930 [Hydrangea phyllody phytoplasma]